MQSEMYDIRRRHMYNISRLCYEHEDARRPEHTSTCRLRHTTSRWSGPDHTNLSRSNCTTAMSFTKRTVKFCIHGITIVTYSRIYISVAVLLTVAFRKFPQMADARKPRREPPPILLLHRKVFDAYSPPLSLVMYVRVSSILQLR